MSFSRIKPVNLSTTCPDSGKRNQTFGGKTLEARKQKQNVSEYWGISFTLLSLLELQTRHITGSDNPQLSIIISDSIRPAIVRIHTACCMPLLCTHSIPGCDILPKVYQIVQWWVKNSIFLFCALWHRTSSVGPTNYTYCLFLSKSADTFAKSKHFEGNERQSLFIERFILTDFGRTVTLVTSWYER